MIFSKLLPISALKKENLGLLIDKIFQHLPDGEPLYESEQFTDRTERFLAAEFIREKLLERMREELPYTSAVLVRSFDESRRTEKNLVVIDADILVERSSQQGIVLGCRRFTACGISEYAARKDLEQLLGCQVYLNLHVTTAPNWRNDDTVLDQLEL